jgi:hypothetical protein
LAEFKLVSQFQGYITKVDPTNSSPGVLVAGSRNVLINEGERVQARQGYTLDGQPSTAATPIRTSFDWTTRAGGDRNLRAYDDELEYRYVDEDGIVTWRKLADGFTSVEFNFAEWWDSTELISRLLMVNGTSNIFDWSGALTTFASATANTITKEGVTTWAEEGFYTSGTRTVVIDNITYTYTGGESTTTLTGVTPDPTGGGHAVGAVIHQGLRTTPNTSIADLPDTFQNDLISVIYQYVYIGSFVNQSVYVSQQNSITVFTFSAPRTPGQGAILNLDSCPTAFIPQEDGMYISSGTEDWYYSVLELATDQATEALFVKKLKTTPQGAAQSQALTGKIKNNIVYVTFEPTLDTLGPIELVQNPQQTNISDPIKPDFDSLSFTDASIFYFRELVLIALPAEGLVYIYNMSARSVNAVSQSGSLASGTFQKFWEAPQILPISRFAIIDGELYGHSSQVPETYKLFTGYNDNTNPIEAIAAFSYLNFGDRVNKKNFNEYYAEGYITPNTTLNLKLRFNYKGAAGTQNFVISGSDTQIVIDTTGDGSLGKQSLGKKSFAGRGTTVSDALPPKFQVIKTANKIDFRELQVEFSSNGVDQRWELLGSGPQVMKSTAENFDIKQ